MIDRLLTSTISFEVEVGVSGVLVPGYPDTQTDPGMADTMEDVEVMGIELIQAFVIDGIDLLTGIDLKSPEIQRLFANILEATGRDAEDAILQEVE